MQQNRVRVRAQGVQGLDRKGERIATPSPASSALGSCALRLLVLLFLLLLLLPPRSDAAAAAAAADDCWFIKRMNPNITDTQDRVRT